MNRNDTGFSFGVSGDSAEADAASPSADAVDAIEVSSEPVTREEARTLGLRLGDAPAAVQQQKASTNILRIDQLPKELSAELSEKLATAWAHLNKNEIAPALTLAQEIAWEYPRLTAPKLVIARCFINRKEYEKALKLLGAIGEGEMNAEARYYIGLSQSRLGRLGEAMESLKLARASSPDAELRKRAGELLQRLQGEPIACPLCGKKTLYDSMREVGDETVCADCAKTLEGKNGAYGERDENRDGADNPGDGEWDDDESVSRRRKRLRPPLSPADIALRVLLVPCLAAVAWMGLFILSGTAPQYYAPVRELLPDWTYLPTPQQVPLLPDPVPLPAQIAPRLLPAVPFATPALTRAVAFLELRHNAFIESPGNRDWRYGVRFFPQPEGAFAIDAQTGAFHWTPAEADGGKTFDVVFTGSRENYTQSEQINRVAVSPGPRFDALLDGPSFRPGETRRIAAADLDGDGDQELILASGGGGEGEIAVFTLTGGAARPRASVKLPESPAGMGVIPAGDEPWVAVADSGKTRIGYYAFRDGALSEMALETTLPGRALLTAFDAGSSTSAVLCQSGEGRRLLVHRQEGQLRSRKAGEWPVPGAFLWRRIVILPAGGGASAPARCILFGDDAAESAFLFEEGGKEGVPLRLGLSGTLVDAAAGGPGEAFCLVRNDKGSELYRIAFDGAGTPALDGPAKAGEEAAAGGLAVVPGALDGKSMVFALSGNSAGLSIASPGAPAGAFHEWPLPRAARPLGETAVIAGGADGARVAYFDETGSVRAVSLP